ncbi:hypothetical protein BUE76_03800 [Cnuella takakiae]|nr:hypothetical protein BUE76_03800 [Cnuella takakiae]
MKRIKRLFWSAAKIWILAVPKPAVVGSSPQKKVQAKTANSAAGIPLNDLSGSCLTGSYLFRAFVVSLK